VRLGEPDEFGSKVRKIKRPGRSAWPRQTTAGDRKTHRSLRNVGHGLMSAALRDVNLEYWTEGFNNYCFRIIIT